MRPAFTGRFAVHRASAAKRGVRFDRLYARGDRMLKNGGGGEYGFPILNLQRGGVQLKIEVRIDEACQEPMVVVCASKVTREVEDIVRRLSGAVPPVLAGFREDEAVILDQHDILRVYAENGRVLAQTESGAYALRLRLYELEERLDAGLFARISNSEIINLKKVKNFDLSLAGTICVRMKNGGVSYVSRRYVAKIKQVLGI